MEIKERIAEVSTIPPKMRQIVIEFNQKDVHVVKAEVSSIMEFNAILDMVFRFLNDPEKVKNITEPVKEISTDTPTEDPDN